MYKEVLYRSNLDWNASYKNLADSHLAVVEPTQKGILHVIFNKTDTIFCLSPNGMIQVYYKQAQDKIRLYPLLEKMLVPIEGQTLHIEPVHQVITVPYPPPPKTDPNWCKETTPLFNSRAVNAKIVLVALLTVCSCLIVYEVYSLIGIGPFLAFWPDGYALVASLGVIMTFTEIGLNKISHRSKPYRKVR
jgi:hypothetical protein